MRRTDDFMNAGVIEYKFKGIYNEQYDYISIGVICDIKKASTTRTKLKII
jgi:hypothetical protein